MDNIISGIFEANPLQLDYVVIPSNAWPGAPGKEQGRSDRPILSSNTITLGVIPASLDLPIPLAQLLGKYRRDHVASKAKDEIAGAVFGHVHANINDPNKPRWMDIVMRRTRVAHCSPLGDVIGFKNWDADLDRTGYSDRKLLYVFRIHAGGAGSEADQPTTAEVVEDWGYPSAPNDVPYVKLVITGLNLAESGSLEVEMEQGAFRAGNSPADCTIWITNKPTAAKELITLWREKFWNEVNHASRVTKVN